MEYKLLEKQDLELMKEIIEGNDFIYSVDFEDEICYVFSFEGDK